MKRMDEERSWAARLCRQIDASLEAAINLGDGCPARLREAIRYALLAPGKRIRPQLVLLAAQACGGTIEQAMPAAVAIEMVHAYSLVHDDLPAMDDDDLRRGRPTCHRQFDEATAILVGDALQARAFEVISRDMQPPHVALRCCVELAHAAGAESLVGGQADDLAAEFRQIDLEQLESIHQRKTGALFRAAPRLGGIAAHADAAQLEGLTRFGEKIGLAFQVVDDLLDVSGDVAEVGKQTGQDHERGKTTFPAILGAEKSRRRAAALVREARESLAPLGDAAGPLLQIAEFVRRRSH